MTDVVMPQMGESITEGTLTKWLKKIGDTVERDELLFEISTDKVDTEIPSPAAGVLKEVLVEEGETVEINTVVARVDEGGEAAAAPVEEAAPAVEAPAASVDEAQPAEPAPAPAATPAPVPESPKAEVKGPLSPLVRRMAREHNIDLSQITGTGAGGRITKKDVESDLAARPAAAKAVAPVPPAMPALQRVEPMSTMRQKIAEHMIHSVQTSVHVTTVHRVDMTNVAKLRNRFKGQFKAQYGLPLTFLSFVTRAAAQAIRSFTIVNASVEGKNIIYHNKINIGIAVALDEGKGLIVPVIRDADEKSIAGLQRAIVDLATRARSRQLKPDEVAGGTFSITNFGSFGSLFATPVISQPNVAILGVGTVTKEPVVINDAIAIRDMCYIALTFDHRLVDGALADMFAAKVKEILENWNEQVL